MDTKKLSFIEDHQSIASTVAHLHEYFKNSYSHFKIERSRLISELDTVEGEKHKDVLAELQTVEAELSIFGILSDSLSVARRTLHMRSSVNALGADSEVYDIQDEHAE